MSATMQSGLNGRFKKTLAYQLDRLDSILDGLADALNGAVADAVKQAVGAAAREAVKVALAEAVPAEAAPKVVAAETPAQRLMTKAKSKAAGVFNSLKRFLAGTGQKIKQCCTRYTGATVLAGQSALSKVRSRTMRMSMMLGAITSCLVGLFRKESRKVWWGAGIVLSTMLLESYVGTLGTLLLGGGVVYLITQARIKHPALAVSPAVSA